jgi:hypothetical protein
MSLPVEGAEPTDLQPGERFRFTSKPSNMAASTFTAVTPERLVVTRRFVNLRDLPPETPVIAHWHGERRTDAFLSTVGDLAAKAALFDAEGLS